MTRTKAETHTLQCWPGGASFEYRGDPEGPSNQKSLRAGHYQASIRCESYCTRLTLVDLVANRGEDDNDPRLGRYCLNRGEELAAIVCPQCKGEGYLPNPKRNPWRKGTADEWRQIRCEVRAQNYQRNLIQRNVCGLIDDLLKAADEIGGDLGEGFSYDVIRNLYKDPSEWDVDECREYISDNGLDLPPSDSDADADEYLDELREVCTEYAQENPAAVYEWYLVDSWLCRQLHEIGEVTIDNGYGHFWGRTCTGQALIMDGTLQEIAARFERGE